MQLLSMVSRQLMLVLGPTTHGMLTATDLMRWNY
jgi:hypothetical protein